MAKVSSAIAERRSQRRLPNHIDVSYGAGGEFIPASSCDLSATGIGLLGPKLYPVGTELHIRFRAPRDGTGNLLFLRGTVRHATGSRMGIRFSELTEQQEAELRQAIFTLATPG